MAVEAGAFVVGEAEVDVRAGVAVNAVSEDGTDVVEQELGLVLRRLVAEVVGGGALAVEVEGETDVVAAVYADAGGVLRKGGEVAAERSEGAAHGHEAGCALEVLLRQGDGIDGVLRRGRHCRQRQYGEGGE